MTHQLLIKNLETTKGNRPKRYSTSRTVLIKNLSLAISMTYEKSIKVHCQTKNYCLNSNGTLQLNCRTTTSKLSD